MTKIRTGQAPASLTRAQFQESFHVRFYDPAFEGERDAIARLEAIALGCPAGGPTMAFSFACDKAGFASTTVDTQDKAQLEAALTPSRGAHEGNPS